MLRNCIVFIGWLMLGNSYSISAQIITIKDKSNGDLLEMVTLASIKTQEYATTDAHGQVDISSFKGESEICVRMLGFLSDTVSYSQLNTENGELLMQQADMSLDQVVITSTRWNQSKREVPGRISSISSKEVRLQNPQTAADMIGATGEVFIQKSQLGGGSPMIRGFATNRVLIVVNGVRMNTAIFRSGNVQNIINIDPFTVERSEVLFGPGSVIYGSDAIGGVMNFRTLTPILSLKDKPVVGGNAVFRFSSAGTEVTGHADVNVGWKKWASLTSFSYSRYGNLRMGKHGPEDYLQKTYVKHEDGWDVEIENENPLLQQPTSYSQTNFMQKLRYTPNKKWNFQYGFHYSTTSEYGRYDRHLRRKNGLPRYGEWSYGPQLWMMNALDVSNHSETAIYSELNIRLAHQLFRESRISRNFNSDTRTINEEVVQAYSLNIDFKKSIGEKHTVFYGLESIFNDVFSTGKDENIFTETSIDAASRYPRSNWTSLGAYLTYRYRPSEKIALQGGVRYNHFVLNANFDTTFYPLPFTKTTLNKGAVTGSLGAVYNPAKKWSLSLNLSTGFRSPNVDDMGKIFDSEPGSVVVPNPDLNAEYVYNAELGIAKVFGKWLKIDATVYYTFLQNALVRRDFTLNGQDSIIYDGEMSKVQAIQNAASAFVYGVQAGIEVKFPKGFSIVNRFSYQKGVEELDDGTTSPLRHAGPWFGSSHLTYSYKTVKLDFYAIYNGEITNNNLAAIEQSKDYLYAKDSNGNPYSPSWYTLNFKALFQLDKHVLLTTGLENITNQRYRTYSSGLTAPGTNFIISVRAMF